MSHRELDLDIVALAVENALGLLDYLQATTEDIDFKSIRATAGLARDQVFKIHSEVVECLDAATRSEPKP